MTDRDDIFTTGMVTRVERYRKKRERSLAYRVKNFIKLFDPFIIKDILANLHYKGIRFMVGATILEGIIRIPVSLKVETNTEFYQDFVVPLRDNKELSEFIVNILKSYHSDERVRTIVDEVIEGFTPLGRIQQQLRRIQQEHANIMATTTMLGQHVESSIEQAQLQITDGVAPVQQLPAPSKIEERLSTLEKDVPEIHSKLNQILEVLSTGALRVLAQEQPLPTNSVGVVNSESSTPVVEEEEKQGLINSETTVNSNHQDSTSNKSTQIEDASGSQPPLIVIGGDDEDEEVEVKPNLPSSFGKLARSLKKS